MISERAATLTTAAYEFKAQGYSPWPSAPGSKQPLNVNGRTWGGLRNHKALTDDEIDAIWNVKRPPDLCVIIIANHRVLDLDPKNEPGVVAMFDKLIAATRCAHTPSGGLHAFFSVDGAAPKIVPVVGVDVQGSGALVIVPPSVGRTWANDLPEADWESLRDL